MELRVDNTAKIASGEDFKKKLANLALDTQIMASGSLNCQKSLYKEPFHLLKAIRSKIEQNSNEVNEARRLVQANSSLAAMEINVVNLKNSFTNQAQKRDQKLVELKNHSSYDFLKIYSEDVRNEARTREAFEIFMSKREENLIISSIQNTVVKQTPTLVNHLEKQLKRWQNTKSRIMSRTQNPKSASSGYIYGQDMVGDQLPIITRGMDESSEKKSQFITILKDYIKTKNRRRREQFKTESRDFENNSNLNSSFRSIRFRQDADTSRDLAARDTKVLFDLGREIKSLLNLEEAKDFITIIESQIYNIAPSSLQSPSRKVAFEIVKNTIDLLNRTERSKINAYATKTREPKSLGILNPSVEATQSDYVYTYFREVVTRDFEAQGITVIEDQEGVPVWGVILYLLRSGELQIMEHIIQNSVFLVASPRMPNTSSRTTRAATKSTPSCSASTTCSKSSSSCEAR